ncbi:MAG TPA: hypothetical protein VH277_02990 [Gemmatimonadaceae bacterium]|nr:hypothetical protein [Gemmatimonadaceae bacterium]
MFCRKRLGTNEVLESFPVGKRLVFDAATGRLWVVCTRCERWNLTPLDERWEAIEQAERLYRDASKRVASENMGFARLRDGTALIRVGKPLRPEFAAWRYGDQFGHRRRVQIGLALTGTAAVGTILGGIISNGIGIGMFVVLGGWALEPVLHGRQSTVVARIHTDTDGVVRVQRRHLRETTIGRKKGGGMTMHLAFEKGSVDLEGKAAERAVAVLLPKVNGRGGRPDEIRWAVDAIEERGGSEAYFDEATKWAAMYTHPFGLVSFPRVHALAFEMALHEDVERRAMHGELGELVEAWRKAEEIGRIADNLLPASVDEGYHKLEEKSQ